MIKIISFSGIDGCGKTSIIDTLQKVFREKGISTRYVWLRYNHYLTKYLLAFCKLIGLTRYEYCNGVRVGYHNFSRSKVISWLLILFSYIDTLGATAVKVYIPAIFCNSLIICDRWIFDIMVDLETDTGIRFTAESLTAKTFKKLLPRSALCLLIQRDTHFVWEGRIENTFDRNFVKRYKLFERLIEDPRIKVIDNNGSIEDAVDQVKYELDKAVSFGVFGGHHADNLGD